MNRPTVLPNLLKDYINCFRRTAELYRLLSRSAPNEREQRMLNGFSHECQQTAEELSGSYRAMTGYISENEPVQIKETGSYRSVIRGRIGAETGLSRQLREVYMDTNNYRLKRIFFTAYHEAFERSLILMEMLINS